MAATPAALQLRLLQTVVEVAAEKNSTLVLPFPVELLRFLERATPSESVEQAVAAPRPVPATTPPPETVKPAVATSRTVHARTAWAGVATPAPHVF
jgi:hypothetical protein